MPSPSLVRCADDFGRHTSSNASKSKIKWPQEAVKEVHGWLKKGLRVVDADLSGYFDTIPHGQLMKSLGRASAMENRPFQVDDAEERIIKTSIVGNL